MTNEEMITSGIEKINQEREYGAERQVNETIHKIIQVNEQIAGLQAQLSKLKECLRAISYESVNAGDIL